MSLDQYNVPGFTLSERKSRRHPVIKMTYVDYADDLAIVTDKRAKLQFFYIKYGKRDWFEYKFR